MSRLKRLLLVAFHFPPLQGSTGISRILSFARYLPQFGWDPVVLTASACAYPEVRAQNLELIPQGLRVIRAPALDASRHLAIRGRYPGFLARPDRWQSWGIMGSAWAAGSIPFLRPAAVLSTYPLASAHRIGLNVQRLFGLPWIADFRDPMVQDNYPPDLKTRRAFQKIERATFERASRVLVTTDGAAEFYAARYPQFPRSSLLTLANGFDPDMFSREPQLVRHDTSARGKCVLLHSGLLYPKERDPSAFFAALGELRREGRLPAGQIAFVFRGSGHEARFQPQIEALQLQDIVTLAPSIPYAQALDEMLAADAFMLLQAANCNQQIPAKVYEYLYAGKPILGLTDPAGDTGRLLTRLGIDTVAPLDDTAAIKRTLVSFLERFALGKIALPSRETVQGFSRRSIAGSLAGVLDRVVAEHGGVH